MPWQDRHNFKKARCAQKVAWQKHVSVKKQRKLVIQSISFGLWILGTETFRPHILWMDAPVARPHSQHGPTNRRPPTYSSAAPRSAVGFLMRVPWAFAVVRDFLFMVILSWYCILWFPSKTLYHWYYIHYITLSWFVQVLYQDPPRAAFGSEEFLST